MSDNPLLDLSGLPRFSAIRPEHVQPALDRVLEANRERLAELTESAAREPTWESFVQPLEDLDERLGRVWSPVAHLNSVADSEPLRRAYNACLPKLSAYHTELGQNRRLYEGFEHLASSAERLDTAQRRVVDNALRDFRLAGVDLPAAKRQRFKDIEQELPSLTARFAENLLDATHAWNLTVTDPEQLRGIPESACALAREKAREEGLEGWIFTLEAPSYIAVMSHADDRELRRRMYRAYSTRASDQGPDAGRWDNTPIMERIVALRHEQAQLLGFANFADRSLETKMAPSPRHVLEFLHDLASRSLELARTELESLTRFAAERDDLGHLEAWDIAYYSELEREHLFGFSQEQLRDFFPLEQVLSGLFELIHRLYEMRVRPVGGVDVWHPDVRFYEIVEADGSLRGQFYLDLYARPRKRGGAWMDECLVRKKTGAGVQTPVALLTCNFSPPLDELPSRLTHNEVLTLFHEVGHGLHHMLTRVDYPSVAGIRGVAWDAVELPSQFMENWCWVREVVDLISGHWRSGEKLPQALFDKLYRAKSYQAGMQMVRQLEFAIFDLRLYREYLPEHGPRIHELLQEVRADVAAYRVPDFNRFAHGFSHIFSGGYAAGYYSYKWAEVLSSDAFARFEENGLFDHATGLAFLQHILEQGGSRDPMELFIAFRGREPNIDALLRHSGIAQ